MGSREYFESVAPRWDELRARFFSQRVREAAFAAARLRAGELAVDVGAGTGYVTEGLLRRGVAVVAVDRSEAMLAVMRRKFRGARGLRCCVGDGASLPLSDRSVDYVFANMYLHHVERPPEAIGEMTRVLKPGGRLVVTDLDTHGFEFLKREHHDRWLGFERGDVGGWFTGAGLARVSVASAGERCCARSGGGEDAAVGIFVAVGTKAA